MPRRYTAEKSGLWCGKAGDSVRGTTDRGGAFMYIRTTKFSQAAAGIAIAGALTLAPARAQETVKLRLSLPMTGGRAFKDGRNKVGRSKRDYDRANGALNVLKQIFAAGGGEIVEEVKVPLANPDFAPFLQRMKDAKPDAMFVFVPAGQGGNFMK